MSNLYCCMGIFGYITINKKKLLPSRQYSAPSTAGPAHDRVPDAEDAAVTVEESGVTIAVTDVMDSEPQTPTEGSLLARS